MILLQLNFIRLQWTEKIMVSTGFLNKPYGHLISMSFTGVHSFSTTPSGLVPKYGRLPVTKPAFLIVWLSSNDEQQCKNASSLCFLPTAMMVCYEFFAKMIPCANLTWLALCTKTHPSKITMLTSIFDPLLWTWLTPGNFFYWLAFSISWHDILYKLFTVCLNDVYTWRQL